MWNDNVFWGENKHCFFKEAVLMTNYWKPEHQLLAKESVLSTVRALMNGSFLQSDLKISAQTACLRKAGPKLLESVVSVIDRTINEKISDDSYFEMSPSHLWLAVWGKLKQAYVKRLGLPLKVFFSKNFRFGQLMELAMIKYKIDWFNWGSKKLLYWYKQCFFTDKSTSKQFTTHVGDYVELLSGQFASVKHVYTYCSLFDKCRQVFLFIQLLEMAPYRDEILHLNIFQSTRVNWIIPLFAIKAAKLYLVLIKQSRNYLAANESEAETDLLNCDWNINFLWGYFLTDFEQAHCQISFQYEQIFVLI